MKAFKTLGALLNDGDAYTVKSWSTGLVVRRLVVNRDSGIVDIDFGGGVQLGLSLEQMLYYEPWFMDRGSILFQHEGAMAKFCTEGDTLCGETGDTFVMPDMGS